MKDVERDEAAREIASIDDLGFSRVNRSCGCAAAR
jgi:hypothetical protein